MNNALTNIDQFIDHISRLENTKLQGDQFELFSKFYLMYINGFDKVYLSSEIPDKISKELNIYTINKDGKEKGIDIIIFHQDEYYSVQCKFRSDKNNKSSYNEVSNFLHQSKTNKISRRYWITTAYDVHIDFKKEDKCLNCLPITYDRLSEDCDGNIMFWNKFNQYIRDGSLNISDLINKPTIPYDIQEIILLEATKHYTKYDLGRLISCCGSGKTLLGYWIFNKLNLNTCIIFVPSLELLSQTYYEWKREFKANNIEFEMLLIGSQMMDKINEENLDLLISTESDEINKFIEKNKKTTRNVIISTYNSSHILIKSLTDKNIKYDFTIYDEAHHTCQFSDNQIYSRTIKADISNKKLFMTATEKILNYRNSYQDDEIISMDNEKLYGQLIYSYNVYQAILNNRLSDYKIISPCITTDIIDKIIKLNSEIIKKNNKIGIKTDDFIVAYLILESIKSKDLRKMILYSSNRTKAKAIENAINILLEESYSDIKARITTFYIIGETNRRERKKLISEFVKSDIGIISSVRVFSEGVNIPICDSVCFCDIKSSEFDVIQSIGRCLRKIYKCPKCSISLDECKCLSEEDKHRYISKIGYVIVPLIIKEGEEFFSSENQAFNKIRRILKIMGTIDETVREKFELVSYQESSSLFPKNLTKTQPNIIVYNTSKTNNQIDLEILQKSILNYTFDRYGNIIDFTRLLLINENEVRYKNNLNLIDSRNKAIEFLKSQGQNVEELQECNWIKYCLGAKLFDKIRQKYIWDLDTLRDLCHSINIYSWQEYQENYHKHIKLPPPQYLNDGFYYDLNKTFNMTNLLTETLQDSDF
jgi:predicted helicase